MLRPDAPPDVLAERAQDEDHAGVTGEARKWHNAVAALQAHLASDSEMVEHVATLIAKKNGGVNQSSLGRATPLLLAVLDGHVADVCALLAFGANPSQVGQVWDWLCQDADDQNERTTECIRKGKVLIAPLAVAAREGHVEIVKLLLARKDVDVNQAVHAHRAADCGSALSLACATDRIEIVQILLGVKGIQLTGVTIEPVDGETSFQRKVAFTAPSPFQVACRYNRVAIVTLLMGGAVDVNPRGNCTASPLSFPSPLAIACKYGQ